MAATHCAALVEVKRSSPHVTLAELAAHCAMPPTSVATYPSGCPSVASAAEPCHARIGDRVNRPGVRRDASSTVFQGEHALDDRSERFGGRVLSRRRVELDGAQVAIVPALP